MIIQVFSYLSEWTGKGQVREESVGWQHLLHITPEGKLPIRDSIRGFPYRS